MSWRNQTRLSDVRSWAVQIPLRRHCLPGCFNFLVINLVTAEMTDLGSSLFARVWFGHEPGSGTCQKHSVHLLGRRTGPRVE